MIEFDHAQLAQRLAPLPTRLRPVFAAMVAERLLPHGTAFFEESGVGVLRPLRLALDQIWRYGNGESIAKAELDQALEASMAAIQAAAKVATVGETIPLTGVQRKAAEELGATPTKLRDIPGNHQEASTAFYAESAASSIAYGLRAISSDDPREPAWAGQSAYDAVDRFVLMEERNRDKPWTEGQIRSHPVIQQELQRQLRDIDGLVRLSAKPDSSKDQLATLREVARSQARTVFSAPSNG